ncbi:hypothetical protein IWW39_000444 [Coemansia spiralis]|uniref:Uncharacterized protein n=1 Tax=Coemansia spiralis TaxID=417178 RepID=A0A9W8GPA3_9FUNG|nr:hypothetical protein IWW39_000444 [Coemansia spiralis]
MDNYDDAPFDPHAQAFSEFILRNDTYLVIGLDSDESIAEMKARSIMKRLAVAFLCVNMTLDNFADDLYFDYDDKYKFAYAYYVENESAECPEKILDIIRDARNKA